MASIVGNDSVHDSDECREMHCEQCFDFGETADAEGFCNECLEYMCTSCVKYHKRQNPQHNLLDRAAMPQEFCFEQCPIHQKHIRFYCPKCELFACSDCRKTNHTTCDNFNHVSTMATRIEESNELKAVLKDIDLISNSLKKVQNTLEDGVKDVETKEKLAQKSIEQSGQSRKSHFEEEQQKCTATFDKYLKDISSVIEEEKQRTVTRLRKEQNDLDMKLSCTENKKLEELRKSAEEDVRAHRSLLARNASLLDKVKGTSCDLYQKMEINQRCKLLIAMKNTASEVKKLKQELLMLTNQTAALKKNSLPDQIITDARSFQASVMSQSTRNDGNKSTKHLSEVTRLIVVTEKQTVYKKFPIPLINFLEKHLFTINTMLSPEQQQIVVMLEKWAEQFVKQRNFSYTHRGQTTVTKVGDVFIGYHDDTCSAIVLDVWNKQTDIEDEKDRDRQVLQESKAVLLWCAIPESLIRLEHSSLSNREKELLKGWYFNKQSHDNLLQYLNVKIVEQKCRQLFAQITTHYKLLTCVHKGEIGKATGIDVDKILLLKTLPPIDTEQQLRNMIIQHIQSTVKDPSLMVIQCDSDDVNANLIACARYCVMDEFEKMCEELRAPIYVVFIVQLPRGASFTGFQCGLWHSAHIEDLYQEDMNMPTLKDMQGKSISKLFTNSAMEIDEDVSREIAQTENEIKWTGAEGTNTSLKLRQGMDKNLMYTNDLGFENKKENVPLQLDDARLELKSVYKHGGQGYGQHRLNVKELILSRVQAALSKVKDKVEHTNKETNRVGLVLKLVHQEQFE
ncbi:E3 ubiquitin-protein ligase rnf213-alpha-like, partial [Ruditapes philippinarum]|uniref:E3 ubiquitin-protein ligase rnf213-alpha-like n=1 Tax=Ruditapes philippinarum TaxID=129788 RepID=UPI00295BA202